MKVKKKRHFEQNEQSSTKMLDLKCGTLIIALASFDKQHKKHR